ncbi:hypothetical protein ACFSCX_02350 [Bacillus salitolerans]|uniref:Guanylate kinase-like domain-containing protein n=1 Tax=Bacillus salitolerans TaxID=1437434 RepID=A0ABW4LJI6_9BACI
MCGKKKFIIAITGAPGTGKTRLTNFINDEYSIPSPRHITTRKPREDDKNGFYKYISKAEFMSNLKRYYICSGDGIRYYGIEKKEIIKQLEFNDIIVINCSLKDLEQLRKKSENIFIVYLTFSNLRHYIQKNTYSRKWDATELDSRITEAIKDSNQYNDLFKNLTINVDQNSFSEIKDKFSETFFAFLKELNFTTPIHN